MVSGVGAELEHVMPSERPWALEQLALAGLARGRIEAADSYARRAEEIAVIFGKVSVSSRGSGIEATIGLCTRSKASLTR
jgi:hypothetical protein